MLIRPLSNELQKKSESELNEIPARLREDLEHIREWLQKQPHLNIRKDDQWLTAFLRGCKFSLQRAKEKLDYFYTMRTLIPEFFADRDPFSPEIQEILKAGAVMPLPKTKGPAGPRIFLFRWENCSSDKITIINLMKVYLMSMDILMNEDDNCMVSGICVWAEFKGFSLSYLLQYTPGFLKKVALCIQKAYPVRIKGIHCTNTPAAYETIFNLLKSFLSEKLKNRMNMYSEGNFKKVHEDIPPSLFPKEFGGENGSIDELAAQWKKKVESYRDWFLEDAKYCSNETLRLGMPKTYDDVFNVEGTFRKLAID